MSNDYARRNVSTYWQRDYQFNHYLAEFMFKNTYDFVEKLDISFQNNKRNKINKIACKIIILHLMIPTYVSR